MKNKTALKLASLILLLSSCSSIPGKITLNQSKQILQENKQNSSGLSEELIQWNENQKITLLRHQLLPIDYLEKNPHIKGLLINHQMGTGKTFLGIGFAERYPEKDVVIFAPRFLKSHWRKNIAIYGVKNPARYKIFQHSNPKELNNLDLTNSIVIIDEAHKFIDKLNSDDLDISTACSKLYLNIRNSYKRLLLTGTPIYNDFIDISYEINLLSDKDILPFNQADFRKQYTTIQGTKSFIRGHVLESKFIAPMVINQAISMGIQSPSVIQMLRGPEAASATAFISGLLIGPLFSIIKSNYPIMNDYDFRDFNVDKLRSVTEKYITYYNFQQVELTDYPGQNIHYMDVEYNDFQLDMMLRFADNALSIDELRKINKDYSQIQEDAYLRLHSSKTQENLKNKAGGGREIGNITYNLKQQNKIIYPEKFTKIYQLMKKSKGPVVVYSHYYHNGILIFANYLKTQGQTNYAILHPDLSENDYENIITNYNDGQIQFLLIHPEITEGISLKGTRQMHILEPSFNKAAQDQIVGRVVRYKSHEHLPQNDRFVDVYVWKQIIPSFSPNYMLALRRNWYANYPEVNFYTEKSIIDKNTVLKSISPDDRSYLKMNTLDKVSENMNNMLKKYSIEVKYQ